ncbi:hypothetical protein [Methanoculleus chikugoensis]|uniref:hypothetical protein n=1 Tax=Methanoculleus chikugoensis TaxID=118126 RepID=UPI000A953AEA|nr:hypothetical protein [Methanoculleus chikugoensis]
MPREMSSPPEGEHHERRSNRYDQVLPESHHQHDGGDHHHDGENDIADEFANLHNLK